MGREKSKVTINTGGSYLSVIPKSVRQPFEPIGEFDVFEISLRNLPLMPPRGLRVRRVDKEPGGNRVIINSSRLTIPKALAYDLGLKEGDELEWRWIDGELWAYKAGYKKAL